MSRQIKNAFFFWDLQLDREYFSRQIKILHRKWIVGQKAKYPATAVRWRMIMVEFQRILTLAVDDADLRDKRMAFIIDRDKHIRNANGRFSVYLSFGDKQFPTLQLLQTAHEREYRKSLDVSFRGSCNEFF